MLRNATHILVVVALVAALSGCLSATKRVTYPPSSELFVTMGDDPGTESNSSYTPKGWIYHTSREWYLPLPLLGLITFGDADPASVFEGKIYREVRQMGGDALTNSVVNYEDPPHWFWRLLGLPLFYMPPATAVVHGQVVKRP